MTNNKLQQRKQQWITKVKQSYNNHTTIVQQWYYNCSTMKKPITHMNEIRNGTEQWKQNWNTVMTHSNEKQQSYCNEKTMKHKKVKTIDQQSYNNRSTMKKQLNTRMKQENETQQWKTTL